MMHSIEGETINPQLVQITDYDEDLEEAYIGPFSDELDEAYDDAYEAESTAILEGSDPALNPQASVSSGGAVSGYTHWQPASTWAGPTTAFQFRG